MRRRSRGWEEVLDRDDGGCRKAGQELGTHSNSKLKWQSNFMLVSNWSRLPMAYKNTKSSQYPINTRMACGEGGCAEYCK